MTLRFILSLYVLVIAVTVTGCAAKRAQQTMTESCPLSSCDPEVNISTRAELLALLGKLSWKHTQCPQISKNVRIAKPISIEGEAVHVPAAVCADKDACVGQPLFAITGNDGNPPEGVSCDLPEDLRAGRCQGISLSTDARLRFSAAPSSHHCGYDCQHQPPTISLWNSCEAACEKHEFRCHANNTCAPDFDSYCRSCLGYERAECSCLSEKGAIPDGTKCLHEITGDVGQWGACQEGLCIP